MPSLTRRVFTERFGDPATFVFKGQFYESSTLAKCALCGRDIRNVYTLHPPQGRSVPSGECCFKVFEKWHPSLAIRLHAAKVLLKTVDEAFKRDVKLLTGKTDLDFAQEAWRHTRRQALGRIRAYQKATQDTWLPKPLFLLDRELRKKPGKTIRWFQTHMNSLQEKLAIEVH